MSIPILLLAAGESKRMEGKIKQLLPWKDVTLLENAVKQANNVADDVYVVLGSNMDTIKKSLSPPINVIHNPNWKSGMGSSISVGVRYVLDKHKNLDGLLIMLADQPLIDSGYLKELQEAFREDSPFIVATAYENRLGVPAVFHHSILPELSDLNNNYGAKHIIQKYQRFTKTVFPKGKEVDVDTPKEYKQLIDNMNL